VRRTAAVGARLQREQQRYVRTLVLLRGADLQEHEHLRQWRVEPKRGLNRCGAKDEALARARRCCPMAVNAAKESHVAWGCGSRAIRQSAALNVSRHSALERKELSGHSTPRSSLSHRMAHRECTHRFRLPSRRVHRFAALWRYLPWSGRRASLAAGTSASSSGT
jgi:hypothetical protein